MKIASKIVNMLALVITVFAIMFCGTFAIPRLFGITPYIVQSPSMTPTINVGDIVFIDTKDKTLQDGDIGAYQMIDEKTGDYIVITHRVVSVKDNHNTYVFRGDANNSDDPDVPAQDIVGKYKADIPHVGYIFAGRDSKIIAIFIIFIVVAANIFSAAFSTFANK